MARILVIDDDVQVRGAVRRILERAGHTVEDVGNGDAGLRAHRERPADLIITDIFMPERDGIETVRQLRRESPQVKIIVISGGDRTQTMDLRKDAELLGAARSLRKPFELSELVQAVGELLGLPSASGAGAPPRVRTRTLRSSYVESCDETPGRWWPA